MAKVSPTVCSYCELDEVTVDTHCMDCDLHHLNRQCLVPTEKQGNPGFSLRCGQCKGLYIIQAFPAKTSSPGKLQECNQCRKEKVHKRKFKGDDQKQKRLDDNGYKCEICGRSITNQAGALNPACTDHCHKPACEEIRGELCRKCNLGLWYFNENPETFAAAITYVARHISKCRVVVPQPEAGSPTKDGTLVYHRSSLR